jgi:CubicO group peptidase (beta-lactamase class C family)
MKLIKIFLCLIFLLFTYSNAQTVSAENNTGATLDEYLRRATANGFSGAVLVAKDGRILLRKGYGWSDKTNKIPITAETFFDIGSHVKAFTATAIMRLEEQGKLSTTDSISKYFADVPADKMQITIHHLLTHTSGLDFDYFYDEKKLDEREILRDKEKYIRKILSIPLGYETGKARSYSNTGFSFLAAIIEKVSGQTYEDYVRENIFKPAGMSNTGYFIPRNYKKTVARGYNDGPTDYGFPWTMQWENGKTALWDLTGNGGMLSNLDEMYKWAVALQGEKIVSSRAKDKMFTVHFAPNEQGYGWYVSKTSKGNFAFVHHSGDAVPHGWNMDFRLFREQNLVIIVLTNKRIRAGSIRRPVSPVLADIVLQNETPQLPPFVSLKLSNLKKYEGIYRLPSGATFHIKTDEISIEGEKPSAQLLVSGEGQQAIDLIFSGNQTAGLTKLSLDLNNKTSAFIEALSKNDAAALKAILPETVSAEDAIKRWNEFVKTNGELQKAEILGTSPLNQSGVQTFVRLSFQKTGGVYHVTWREQKLHEQDEDTLQPAVTAFLRKSMVALPLTVPFSPQSETEFVAYDLFKGRTMKFKFGAEGNLIFQTKDGDITAQKMSKK